MSLRAIVGRSYAGAFLAAAALAGCGPAQPVSIANAELHRSANAVEVTWTASTPKAPIDVYVVKPDGSAQLVSDDDTDSKYVLDSATAATRPLIRLVSASGSTQEIAERVLPLEGGRNFRDLGGYLTQDGERVRWGKLFRSGTMIGLTPNDFSLLRSLSISTICDFRSTAERDNEPTNWQSVSPTLIYQTRDYVADNSALKNLLKDPAALTPDQTREAIITMYREFPYEHAKSYRTLFLDIRDNKLPLAFNCSAGKDRTGVGAALVLSALGVPRDKILEDYSLSDKIVNYERVVMEPASATAAPPKKAAGFEVLAKLTPEQRAPFLASDPAYVEAALNEIVRREGSLDAYYVSVLGLTGADIKAIRANLLEPAPKS